ncbi:MAG TPA: pilus assembly protein PilP [Polyangiaceae bacterium]|nr:pilus assembly protein PilP [Polyangiaceae bacterium]
MIRVRSCVARALAPLGGALLLLACEDEISTAPPPAATPPEATATAAAVSDAGVPKVDFQETEFVENDRSRDPFRANAGLFVEEVRGRIRSQREIVLDHYALDELKLVGIVTRIEPAKAMLVDPTGKGHVVQRGQFVGRPEVVQSTGSKSATYEINWRVDRIREGDIVLIREDPANPDVPSATKVIPLRPEGVGADDGVARSLQ